jgi:acetyl esterase/lipase
MDSMQAGNLAGKAAAAAPARRLILGRREFLLGCAAPAAAQQRLPYPEEQNPKSPRGKELAEFARSLRIRRGIVYVRRPEGALTLDVYSPAADNGQALPVVIAFGLSAFRINETEYRWDLNRLLPAPTANLYPPILARGRRVAVANLRVAPQSKWPAQIHDAKAAVRWVRRHAAEFAIDPTRIGLFGASASGNLCSLVALTARSGELEDPQSDDRTPTTVRAVCSMAGIYDFEHYQKVDSGDGSLTENVLGSYLGETDRYYREASASTYVKPGAPPFLLLHGRQDRRVPFSQMAHFAALLRRAGVEVETVEIDRYQHGPLPGELPDPGYEVTDRRIYAFFDRHLNR